MDSYEKREAATRKFWTKVSLVGTAFTVIVILALMFGMPIYGVWQQGLAGKAALERATQDRQIAIQEAQALKESAVFKAEAEILRAQGVAKANKIIGDSLKGNEAYLRYLFIDMLRDTGSDGRETIYIPTEAGLPILEAARKSKVQISTKK